MFAFLQPSDHGTTLVSNDLRRDPLEWRTKTFCAAKLDPLRRHAEPACDLLRSQQVVVGGFGRGYNESLSSFIKMKTAITIRGVLCHWGYRFKNVRQPITRAVGLVSTCRGQNTGRATAVIFTPVARLKPNAAD
jgi:hypothetical protein